MSQETPFTLRSTKTKRSPPTSSPGGTQSPLDEHTPHQSTELPTHHTYDKTKYQQQVVPRPIIIKTEPIEEAVTKQVTNKITSRPSKNTEGQGQANNDQTQVVTIIDTNPKMNIQQIQQQITSCVQEFSGANTNNRLDDLNRFMDSADMVYSLLTTQGEKEIFDRLIKFRLIGDAYTRINNRQTKNYTELKNALQGMYIKTYTLEELEKEFHNIRQQYNESLRDYGYRISEAMEKYKRGYRIKYGLQNIDETYAKHLNTNATQIFKRGLSNSILKERVLVSRAKTIDEILDETEEIEKILMAMASPIENSMPAIGGYQQIRNQIPQTRTDNNQHRTQNLIMCNYCNRPNHTWDVCRTRINAEERAMRAQQQQTTPYQNNIQPPRNSQHIQPQPRFYPQKPQEMNRYQPPQRQPIPQNYQNRYPTQQPRTENNRTIQQYNNYRQPQNQNYTTDRPPKYCSHCKTTVGHTFEECRNKYQTNQNHVPYSHNHNEPQQQPPDSNIEEMFSNMRINTIITQPPDEYQTDNIQEQLQYQENSNGSNQL